MPGWLCWRKRNRAIWSSGIGYVRLLLAHREPDAAYWLHKSKVMIATLVEQEYHDTIIIIIVLLLLLYINWFNYNTNDQSIFVKFLWFLFVCTIIIISLNSSFLLCEFLSTSTPTVPGRTLLQSAPYLSSSDLGSYLSALSWFIVTDWCSFLSDTVLLFEVFETLINGVYVSHLSPSSGRHCTPSYDMHFISPSSLTRVVSHLITSQPRLLTLMWIVLHVYIFFDIVSVRDLMCMSWNFI